MLFRQEAIEARLAKWDHSERTSVDALNIGTVVATCVVAGLGMIYLATASIPRRHTVAGVLEAQQGTANLASPFSAVVSAVRVKDGEHVLAGQPLIVLTNDAAVGGRESGTKVSESIEQQRLAAEREILLRTRFAQQRKAALEFRVSSLKTQKDSLVDTARLAQKRTQISAAELQRTNELANAGLLTRATAQQREMDHLENQSRETELRRQANTLEQDLATAQAELANVDPQLSIELENLNRSIALYQQTSIEAQARTKYVISAPLSGAVSLFRAKIGETVSPNQTLAAITSEQDILADGTVRLRAVLYVPSKSIGTLSVGDMVQLRFHAFPHQKFGAAKGKIQSISAVALEVTDIPVNFQRRATRGELDGEAFYKLLVSVDYTSGLKLRPGLTLDADIQMDKRRIWEWILDPFLKARSSISNQGGQ